MKIKNTTKTIHNAIKPKTFRKYPNEQKNITDPLITACKFEIPNEQSFAVTLNARCLKKTALNLDSNGQFKFLKAILLTSIDLFKKFLPKTIYTFENEISMIFSLNTIINKKAVGNNIDYEGNELGEIINKNNQDQNTENAEEGTQVLKNDVNKNIKVTKRKVINYQTKNLVELISVISGFSSVKLNQNISRILTNENKNGKDSKRFINELNDATPYFTTEITPFVKSREKSTKEFMRKILNKTKSKAFSSYVNENINPEDSFKKTNLQLLQMLKDLNLDYNNVPHLKKYGIFLKKLPNNLILEDHDNSNLSLKTIFIEKDEDFLQRIVLSNCWLLTEEEIKRYQIDEINLNLL